MSGHVVPLRSHHRRRARQRDPAGTERDVVEVARPAGHGGPPDAARQHRRPARRRPRARKTRNSHRPATRTGAVVGVARRFPEYSADPGPALRLPRHRRGDLLGDHRDGGRARLARLRPFRLDRVSGAPGEFLARRRGGVDGGWGGVGGDFLSYENPSYLLLLRKVAPPFRMSAMGSYYLPAPSFTVRRRVYALLDFQEMHNDIC